MKKEQKEGFKERLRKGLDVQPDVFPGESMIEIRGKRSMTVHGCKKILVYKSCEIELSLKGGSLSIFGSELICTSYFVDAVIIEGKISKVCFGEEEVWGS